ncbi:autotransporter outer membrane beta-barrel domain-containing protein [Piscinibacter sp. HJYY11]|uniref:autotransporter outer membrane beta-barrel domain-containing protein n=1 Tax=Piscinibacter sp. HJYY11 TaxID=2801333 RepID=UPI00191F6FA2|nr:autotransporter outer membrane beta-barrel domain-containing protein [Piscinibacter sp. HJYY11]MBL0727842.1 autotransporter outer membrane beta-barrel domain-containing protein [Piscinibacter sp. HJYY11]
MKKSNITSLSSLAVLPCLLSVAADASAAIECSPNAMVSGSTLALVGNCIDTDTNLAITSGAEVWHIGPPGSSSPLGTRNVSGGALTVPALPGEHTYYISAIDNGYGGLVSVAGEGGYPSTVVNLPCPGDVQAGAATRARATRVRRQDHDCAAPAPHAAELATPLMAVQGQRLQSNLDHAQSRMRILRRNRNVPAFDVQGVPLPVKKNDDPAASARETQRLGVYLLGLGDYLRQNRSDTQSEFRLRSTALSIGADYRLNDEWVFGANAGGSNARIDFAESLSRQKSKGGQATAYANWNVTASGYVSATVSYEATRYALQRDDGIGGVAEARPGGRGLGLSLSAGRDLNFGAWSVGPYLRIDSVTSRVEAFEESGSTEALSVSRQTVRSTSYNLGAQVQTSLPVSWGLVLPYVRVEATRRTQHTRDAASATLVNGNTTVLIPTTADTSAGYGNVALGLSSVHQGGMSWYVDYETGVAQKGYRSQRLGLGLRFEL